MNNHLCNCLTLILYKAIFEKRNIIENGGDPKPNVCLVYPGMLVFVDAKPNYFQEAECKNVENEDLLLALKVIKEDMGESKATVYETPDGCEINVYLEGSKTYKKHFDSGMLSVPSQSLN